MVGIINFKELEDKLDMTSEELFLNDLYKHLEVSDYEYLENQILFDFSSIFKEVKEFFNFKCDITNIELLYERKTNMDLLIDFLNSCFNTNFKDINEFFTERLLLLSSTEERINLIFSLFISLYNKEELDYELLETFGFNEKIYNSTVSYKHFINFNYEIACKYEQVLYTLII